MLRKLSMDKETLKNVIYTSVWRYCYLDQTQGRSVKFTQVFEGITHKRMHQSFYTKRTFLAIFLKSISYIVDFEYDIPDQVYLLWKKLNQNFKKRQNQI